MTRSADSSLVTPTFVFLGGAGLNAWIWDGVSSALNRPCLAVDFPRDRTRLSLEHYAAEAIRQVNARDANGPIILVAHSSGGVIALHVAAQLQGRVVGFAAISAVIPRAGGSFLSTQPPVQRILMHAIMRLAGTRPPTSVLEKSLCHDLSGDLAQRVVRDFTPESLSLYTGRTLSPRLGGKYVYVTLEDDRALSMDQQRCMARNLAGSTLVSLASGHMVMLKDPVGLARVLENAFPVAAEPVTPDPGPGSTSTGIQR